MVDLSDVYMTFSLPTAATGKVAIGTKVRPVLDAAPQYVIPATASFVTDVAQFTPKTVETAREREELMFRIKAQIPAKLLNQAHRAGHNRPAGRGVHSTGCQHHLAGTPTDKATPIRCRSASASGFH